MSNLAWFSLAAALVIAIGARAGALADVGPSAPRHVVPAVVRGGQSISTEGYTLTVESAEVSPFGTTVVLRLTGGAAGDELILNGPAAIDYSNGETNVERGGSLNGDLLTLEFDAPTTAVATPELRLSGATVAAAAGTTRLPSTIVMRITAADSGPATVSRSLGQRVELTRGSLVITSLVASADGRVLLQGALEGVTRETATRLDFSSSQLVLADGSRVPAQFARVGFGPDNVGVRLEFLGAANFSSLDLSVGSSSEDAQPPTRVTVSLE